MSLFTVSPVPAPMLALLVTVGVVLVYSTVVGREQRSGAVDQTVATDGGRRTSATIAGFQSLVHGTKQYVRGFTEIDNWVAASKRPWNPITAALGITVLAVLWFTQVSIVGVTGPEARWTGYLLKQAGLDSGSYTYWGSVLFKGKGVRLTADMVMITTVIVGAFVAAFWSGDFSIRFPKRRRIPNAVIGGFLMGAGSRLAPGCNIGNIYSGLAELSIHSFIATIGIVAGVYVMTHWIYRDIGCAV